MSRRQESTSVDGDTRAIRSLERHDRQRRTFVHFVVFGMDEVNYANESNTQTGRRALRAIGVYEMPLYRWLSSS